MMTLKQSFTILVMKDFGIVYGKWFAGRRYEGTR